MENTCEEREEDRYHLKDGKWCYGKIKEYEYNSEEDSSNELLYIKETS